MEASGYLRLRRRALHRALQHRPERRDVRLVLFDTQGRPEDEAAIRTLCAAFPISNAGTTVLRIVHVLTVPMTVPLGVPLPEADEASARILHRARVVAGVAGIAIETTTLRGRTVAEALVDDARTRRASAIVIRLRGRETMGAHVLLSPTVRALLRDAPCAVIIMHLPHAHPAPASIALPMGGHGAR